MSIAALLKKASEQLVASDSARLDAELLLCFVLNWQRSQLYAYMHERLSIRALNQFHALLRQRMKGCPIAYLIGEKEFWSKRLKVTQNTLIPRPDTELLVEAALALMPKDTQLKVLELGTGSGAIAIALAAERPKLRIVATEIDKDALLVAQQNAKRYNIQNISFKRSNWFSQTARHAFDMILANPPYIAQNDFHLLQGDVQFEPRQALVSGHDGLKDIQFIISNAGYYLKRNGWLLLEHGFQQGAAVRRFFKKKRFSTISTLKDYSYHERVTMGRFIALREIEQLSA